MNINGKPPSLPFAELCRVDVQPVHRICLNRIDVLLESERFTKPPADDMFYSRTKGMLTCLGLQNYEKNFKKGIFNDATLPLLTDSALRDVNIPPGPRLLILDHIQRNRDLV
ncbi:hypothetical protein ZIOFF_013419 [Zingiber officinale]|uniref:SAM domain-containing protein n=1 Tax=Zingiber officinale TaxID=94328 RepID=A0A8J5LCR7_ZINOF|nr:hypothetical protein ZIOFF_013419 [Zingiber officinale]